MEEIERLCSKINYQQRQLKTDGKRRSLKLVSGAIVGHLRSQLNSRASGEQMEKSGYKQGGTGTRDSRKQCQEEGKSGDWLFPSKKYSFIGDSHEMLWRSRCFQFLPPFLNHNFHEYLGRYLFYDHNLIAWLIRASLHVNLPKYCFFIFLSNNYMDLCGFMFVLCYVKKTSGEHPIVIELVERFEPEPTKVEETINGGVLMNNRPTMVEETMNSSASKENSIDGLFGTEKDKDKEKMKTSVKLFLTAYPTNWFLSILMEKSILRGNMELMIKIATKILWILNVIENVEYASRRLVYNLTRKKRPKRRKLDFMMHSQVLFCIYVNVEGLFCFNAYVFLYYLAKEKEHGKCRQSGVLNIPPFDFCMTVMSIIKHEDGLLRISSWILFGDMYYAFGYVMISDYASFIFDAPLSFEYVVIIGCFTFPWMSLICIVWLLPTISKDKEHLKIVIGTRTIQLNIINISKRRRYVDKVYSCFDSYCIYTISICLSVSRINNEKQDRSTNNTELTDIRKRNLERRTPCSDNMYKFSDKNNSSV